MKVVGGSNHFFKTKKDVHSGEDVGKIYLKCSIISLNDEIYKKLT
jgi:hypothetical protein